MNFTKKRIDAIADEFERIAREETGEAAEYAVEFAAYMAGLVPIALADQSGKGVRRIEAMSLAFAETIDEMGDQAAKRIVFRIVEHLRFILAVFGAAAIA